MALEPDAAEIRVVACLVEKQRTTPDTYPLSLNALRLACNQSTNRDPVVEYDEATVSDALRRLALRGWTRLASGAGSRARKYRHLLPERLELDDAELSLLAVLMLRGAQTPGELKQRTDRLHGFTGLADVEEALEGLVGRELVARQERRPGQKEVRYAQLLGGGDGNGEPATTVSDDRETPTPIPPDDPAPPASGGAEDDRLAGLEQDLLEIRGEIAKLRELMGASGPEQPEG
jgi:uncharacterized protein